MSTCRRRQLCQIPATKRGSHSEADGAARGCPAPDSQGGERTDRGTSPLHWSKRSRLLGVNDITFHAGVERSPLAATDGIGSRREPIACGLLSVLTMSRALRRSVSLGRSTAMLEQRDPEAARRFIEAAMDAAHLLVSAPSGLRTTGKRGRGRRRREPPPASRHTRSLARQPLPRGAWAGRCVLDEASRPALNEACN